MLEIRSLPWDQTDIRELALLTCAAFQASKDRGLARISVEGMEQWFRRLRFDVPPVVLQVHSDGKVLGGLLLFIQDETRVEINPWALNGHPFVLSEEEDERIAIMLLQEAQAYVRSQGYTRLELNFKQTAGDPIPFYERYPEWYTSLGFQVVTETAIMRRPLKTLGFEIPQLPLGFRLHPLLDFEDETIYRIYYEVYSASLNRFFLDQSDEERRAFFDEDFSRDDPVNEDTSLMLLKDDELVGFSLMRPTHGPENVHLWKFGIHKAYRRRGLGKGLLRLIMARSSEQGLKTMSLGVEPNNTPAYTLYLSHGFKEEVRQTEYVWKPG
ncbi:MAG: GNAT family N-acetyltransferase [Promethearchaeota archaeon]